MKKSVVVAVLAALVGCMFVFSVSAQTVSDGQAAPAPPTNPFAGWTLPKVDPLPNPDPGTKLPADDSAPGSAPTLAVGDRWTWNVIVNHEDTCTQGFASGAQEIQTVTRAGAAGWVIETVGPEANSRYSRTYSNDGSYPAVLDGKALRSTPVAFPLRPGNKWETTLVGPVAIQSLECQVEAPARLKVGSEDLEVIPVVCEGRWKNRQYGNGDKSTHKYWYSPVVGASVRRTVLTWYQGRHCADIEYRLESYARKK
jgi:hypothetical protein